MPVRLSKIISFVKANIRTVEFGLSFACILAALSLGGDMELTVFCLLGAWFFSAFGIGTAPNLSPWRKCALSIAALVIFAAVGGFLLQHFHLSGAGKDAASPTSTAPQTVAPIPHIKLQLVLDSITKTGVWFHLEAENVSENLSVDNLTWDFESTGVAGKEGYPSIPRAMPPKGKIDLPGTLAPQLIKAGFLVVILHYDSTIEGKSKSFESRYRFVLPMNPADHQVVQPASVIAGRTVDDAYGKDQPDLSALYSQPSGTAAIVIPEQTPDGSANVLSIWDSKKAFTADFGRGEIQFTVTFPNGQVETIYQNVFKPQPMHIIMLRWDESKHFASLWVDGVPGHSK